MFKLVTYVRLLQVLAVRKSSLLLIIMAFLLGRAIILEGLAPFSIAYFAAIYFLRKDLVRWVALSLIAGSIFSTHNQTGYITVVLIIFLLIQKGMEKFERSDISKAPVIVLASAFLVKIFLSLVSSNLSWYTVFLIAIESVLSFILTLIFIHSIPIITLKRKSYSLTNEEIISMVILLASVMTGTIGWMLGPGVSIDHVLSRYLVLIFAMLGGAPLGAAVGVLTGLILSLANVDAIYQMSLLAFAGMLAGLLKEGGKSAVGFGMLLGSSILAVYIGNQMQIIHSTWESFAAVALFLVTPRIIIQTVARYVPGTHEHVKTQHDYAKRVRDITAGRVEQFSNVFRQLSQSFMQFTAAAQPERAKEEDNHFMNSVVELSCSSCFKRKHCWDNNSYRSYKYMTDMMTAVEGNESMTKRDIPADWKQACVKTEHVLENMKRQFGLYKHDLHWKKQIQESRHLVADQLSGVSQVMEDLAKEIKREGQELFVQEEQIRRVLEQLGLSIHSIDIVNLEEGNVEIEIIHQYSKGFDECRKIIAPMLSDILGESIAVKKEMFTQKGEGYYTVVFGSAKEFHVETGISGAAKGGDLLSGDSFSTVELGNGKFAVALSDGMGNGERAKAESSAALKILQQLLQSGMDERLAIKSVNSILLLRSSDEVFATVDVALIDLYDAQTTFMKIGSTPSFVKRGTEVIPISANNLPVGILHDIDIDLVSLQLKPGDTLIMMTDGVYDAPGHAVNKELWMKRVIQEIEVWDPQEIADCLLETVVRYHQGEIRDDMTIVVARIDKHKPEWSTFRWPGLPKIERPRTVS